jgi:hypothetical protein
MVEVDRSTFRQCFGSGFMETGSGYRSRSSISSESFSGTGALMKTNLRKQFR